MKNTGTKKALKFEYDFFVVRILIIAISAIATILITKNSFLSYRKNQKFMEDLNKDNVSNYISKIVNREYRERGYETFAPDFEIYVENFKHSDVAQIKNNVATKNEPDLPNLSPSIKFFKILEKFNFTNSAPNHKIFLHTKMPRCGSTTFRKLIDILAKKNNFHFLLIRSKLKIGNRPESLIRYIESSIRKIRNEETELGQDLKPILVMKHTTFSNFTHYGSETGSSLITNSPPTLINVARNPIDRYISHYYTTRYGAKGRPPNSSKTNNQTRRYSTIQQYFDRIRKTNKTNAIIPSYHNWFCGSHSICSTKENDSPINKEKRYQYTKFIILHEYFVIGILEDFLTTLQLFEKLIPDLFDQATKVYQSSNSKIENAKKMSASVAKTGINGETRKWLENGIFSYDMDLYRFIEAKFRLQVQKFL